MGVYRRWENIRDVSMVWQSNRLFSDNSNATTCFSIGTHFGLAFQMADDEYMQYNDGKTPSQILEIKIQAIQS